MVLITYKDRPCCLYVNNGAGSRYLTRKGMINVSYGKNEIYGIKSRREALEILKKQYVVKLNRTKIADRFKEEYYECSPKNNQSHQKSI